MINFRAVPNVKGRKDTYVEIQKLALGNPRFPKLTELRRVSKEKHTF